MMASESAVERCFCKLRNFFSLFRKNMKDPSVRALMGIKINEILKGEFREFIQIISDE